MRPSAPDRKCNQTEPTDTSLLDEFLLFAFYVWIDGWMDGWRSIFISKVLFFVWNGKQKSIRKLHFQVPIQCRSIKWEASACFVKKNFFSKAHGRKLRLSSGKHFPLIIVYSMLLSF